jgi:F0F1-type ATP synthase epsilon subunit
MDESIDIQLVIRTPHEVILEKSTRSVRVLTETGHVGLRPRTEPSVIAVEPGIIYVHSATDPQADETFIGTAGGLMICDHNRATLLTPLAMVGDSETSIVEQLNELMQRPNSEMEARAALSKLEGHILTEIRREQSQDVTPHIN